MNMPTGSRAMDSLLGGAQGRGEEVVLPDK